MLFGKLKDGNYGFAVFKERFESYKEINADEHMSLILRANKEGKLIGSDKDGNPVLIAPPPPTPEEEKRQKISEYEAYLSQTDWYIIRYADTGKIVPEEIKAKRAEAREQLSSLREKNRRT